MAIFVPMFWHRNLAAVFLAISLVLTHPAAARGFVEYGHYAPSIFSETVVLVDWNSTEGRVRLARATASSDFYQLAHHFQTQANGLYCGIASSVIILNAMRAGRNAIPSQTSGEVKIPPAWGGTTIPYPLYTQAGFLDARTEAVKPRAVIEFRSVGFNNQPDPGLTLQQLGDVLVAHGTRSLVRLANLPEADGTVLFRSVLRQELSESEHFVIVNYDSHTLGQAGGGHISPLGAYDEVSDSVLVLDVSGYLNPWFWTPVRDLYLAMHTLDSKTYRGWVVVEEGK